MKYDDMPTYENNATENEWLSVKFTQSKKIDEETKEMMENNGKVKKFFSDGVSASAGRFAPNRCTRFAGRAGNLRSRNRAQNA